MAEIDRWQAKRCSLTVFSVRFDMPLQLVGVPALAGSDRDKEVSKDFKSTLEREIGLDEVVVSPRNYINKSALYADEKQETVVDPNGKHLDKSYTREVLLKITEQQLAASDATSKIESTPESQGVTSQVGEQTSEEQAQEISAAMTTETSIVKSDADTQSSEKSEKQRGC